MSLLSAGRTYTLVEDQAYAMPSGRASLVYVQAGATMEQSNDASTWDAVTLDANDSFLCAAAFIRSTDADTIISLRG